MAGYGSGELNAEDFHALARHLRQIAAATLDRTAHRHQRVVPEVRTQQQALAVAWQSPQADTFNRDLGNYLDVAARAEGPGMAVHEALLTLAGEADRTGDVIGEVEQYEKSWNEQFVANFSEWNDRMTTAMASWLPGSDEKDAYSAELTRRYQEQTAVTEAASARRAEALHLWHRACGVVATALNDAAAVMRSLPVECPASLDATAMCAAPSGGTSMFASGDDQLARAIGAEKAAHPDASADELLAGARSRVQGENDARALYQHLRDAGIDPATVDPATFGILDPDDPASRAILDDLARINAHRDDPAYAAGYVTELGAGGTRVVLAATEGILGDQRRDGHHDDGDRTEALIGDFTHLFALASRDPATATMRTELLDTRTYPDQHLLSVLLADQGQVYDPAFLAAASRRILVDAPQLNVPGMNDRPGAPPYRDPEMAFAPLLAMRAMSQNPDATRQFLAPARSGADTSPELAVVLNPANWYLWHQPIGGNVDLYLNPDMAARMDGYGVTMLDTVLVTDARAEAASRPDGTHPEATNLYRAIVWEAGHNHLDPAVAVKQQLAGASGLYLTDIGTSVRTQGDRPPMTDANAKQIGFARPELLEFFSLLATDQTAAERLGSNIGGWSALRQELLLGPDATAVSVQTYESTTSPIITVFVQSLERAGHTHDVRLAETTANAQFAMDQVFGLLPSVPGPKIVGVGVDAAQGAFEDWVIGNIKDGHPKPDALGSPNNLLASIEQTQRHALADRIAGQTVPDGHVDDVITQHFADRGIPSPLDAMSDPTAQLHKFDKDTTGDVPTQDWTGHDRLVAR